MQTTQNAGTLSLFSTPVILFDLPDKVQINQALVKLIKQKRGSHDGIGRSNLGGWHSEDDMMAWAPEQARRILTQAVELCSPRLADVHPNGKRDFQFDARMWANINGPGNANQMHCHPGALWSGVYYVDVGEDGSGTDVEGELMLQDPRFPMNTMYMPDLLLRGADNEPQYSQFAVRPVNGRIVLFPSWLMHSVRPYRGEGERISVAFNILVSPVKAR